MSTKGYGSITISDVLDGAQIWTTTTAPTSPNYTFTISNLHGDSNAEIKVGDLIFYSYYRYTVAEIGATTVLAGNQQNLRGATGAAGLNNAAVTIYKRGTSAPAVPTATLTYTFASGVLSGSLNGWSQNIPDGTEPLYATFATASSTGTSDTIPTGEWTSPAIKIMENGASGAAGYNQATIFLYQRSNTTPQKPASAVTYTFATAALNTVPTGWSRTIPENNGKPCWVTTAVAVSQSATASIAASAWATVQKLAEDGLSPTVTISEEDGITTINVTDATGSSVGVINRGSIWYSGNKITGTSGTETIFSGSEIPHALIGDHYLNTQTQNTYVCTTAGDPGHAKWVYEQNIKGATGAKGDNGYLHIKYSNDGGATFTNNSGEDPGIYMGTYTDNLPDDSMSVAAYTWARVQGVGISSSTTQYYLSTSDSTQAGGSWSNNVPSYVEGCYYWTREVIQWTDGTTTNGTPVLNNGLTDANGNALEANVLVGEMTPELIVGTHGTTATATWTGTSSYLTTIKTGTRIQYKMTSAGASNVTLNLTLKDGTTTGAIPVYYSNTTRLGTQYGQNAIIDLIFDGSYWRILNPYTDKNDNTVGSYGATSLTAGANGIMNYSLIMKDSETTWASFTKTAGTGTTKAKNTAGFIPDKIYYSSGNATYTSGNKTTTCYDALAINFRYSSNCGTTLVAGKPVYLVGELVNELFYLDDTWWTQDPPSSVDGKVYIYLGIAYSNYQIYLNAENPMYIYYDGKFQLRDDAMKTEAFERANPGIGMKINYSAFATADAGEVYIHGFTNGQPADVDGYVYWNDVKRTVAKGMINPNTIVPYNRYIYIVLRLTSASATAGTKYMVWYNAGWKYAVTPTPTAVGGEWTWDEGRDIVLGQFIETGDEADLVEAYLYWPPRSASQVQTTNVSPYQYSQAAVDWNASYGGRVKNATDMLAEWADGDFATTTQIDGGHIATNTIEARHFVGDHIVSSNWERAVQDSSPFSAEGTRIDLLTGNMYMKNLGVDNTSGQLFLNGNIYFMSGYIGNSGASNYWEVGTKTDYNQNQKAFLDGKGNVYIQTGNFMLSNGLLNTQKYDAQNKITYLYYDSTYWDFGMQAPELNTATTGFVSGVDDNFIYIRKHANTIPSLKTEWDYLFRVDKNGMIWINGESLDQKYAPIGSDSNYIVKSPTSEWANTITGNLKVTGSIDGTSTKATQLTHSLTINGTAWDGSSNTTIGTLGVAYGGTGATTFTSGQVLIGNGQNAITTRAITNNTSANYISGSTNLITANTLKFWNGAYDTNHSSNIEYVKQGLLGDVVTHDFDEFITTDGGIIDGSLQVTDLTAGSLIVTGAARFTNGLFGDLTGNADTADKVNNNLIIKLASGTTEGTNMFTFNGSTTKTVDITKSAIGLGNVENTKLSTWAGSSALTTTKVGTLAGAAVKAVDTSISAGSTSVNLPTSAAVASFVEGKGYVTSSGVTSVRVQATSPVVSSVNTAQSSTLDTTISLADGYGDTKNPYASKTKNYVLAAPSTANGAPTFRALVADDIPTLASSKVGLGNVTNNKQVKGLASGTTSGHLVSWGTDGYTVADAGIAKGSVTTKLTLSGTDYSASSNVITITKANLQSAVQDTSYVLMTTAERSKLESIQVSEGGTIDFSGVTATAPLTATVATDKTVTISHNTSGVSAGTYRSVTVDTYGHVTAGTNPTTLSGYGITDAKIASGVITLGSNTITPLTASSSLNAAKLTGTASVSTTGNATTATKFSSARSITLTGDVTGSASSNGESGWSIATTVGDNSHNHVPSNIIARNDNTSGGLDPITASKIGSAASNKTFGLPANAITIEYSTDGGATWVDYGATDAQKRDLFNETRTTNFWFGKSAEKSVDNQLRVTIEPTDRYTSFHGLYCWMSTSGNTCTVDLERSTIGNKNTFSTVFTGKPLAGRSGNNIIYFTYGTFGGGSTQTGNQYKYRMTFKQTAITTANTTNSSIQDIRFIGDNVWSSPNVMVSKNHMYSWDRDLNVTFPAQVEAPILKTGNNANNYFQTQKLRGEGNASQYTHAIDFGYAGHNQVDFYEYGGIFNFHRHTGAAIGSGDTLLGSITINGWEGNVVGNVTGNVTGTASNVTGTVAVANGGTGKTTGKDAANYFLNSLDTGSSTPVDGDYYISQYVSGGTTTTTYHRRPMSALWSYINGKAGSVYAKLTGATFTGAVTGTSFGASSYMSVNIDNSSAAGGLALFGTNPTTYGIAMRTTANGGKHGYVQGDWGIYSYMTGADNRGWIFKNASKGYGVASISNIGEAVFNGSVTVGGNTTNDSGCRLVMNESTSSLDFIFN